MKENGMDRPDDVPGWAWEKAVEATVGTIGFGAQQLTTKLARAIAQAVAEEREQNAVVAEQEALFFVNKKSAEGATRVAAAIRSRT